jgi:hypothetical protein
MFIASSKIILDTSFCFSLKEKRSIIQKVKQRTKNKFNISIAEVDYQNDWNKVGLGISIVSSDSKHSNRIINKVIDFIEDSYPGLIEDWDLDIYQR